MPIQIVQLKKIRQITPFLEKEKSFKCKRFHAIIKLYLPGFGYELCGNLERIWEYKNRIKQPMSL
jgi:hypothetical protein